MSEVVKANNSKNVRIVLILVFVLIFGFVIYFFSNNLDTPTQYRGGKLLDQQAPDIKLKSFVDGTTYTIADLKGKTVFVNFFNSWCIPCVEEEPALKEFIDENKSNPNFVFISIARQDSKENIQNWIDENNPIQDVIFDEGEISLAFGVTGQPETFAINPEGIVSGTFLSRASKGTLNEMLVAAS